MNYTTLLLSTAAAAILGAMACGTTSQSNQKDEVSRQANIEFASLNKDLETCHITDQTDQQTTIETDCTTVAKQASRAGMTDDEIESALKTNIERAAQEQATKQERALKSQDAVSEASMRDCNTTLSAKGCYTLKQAEAADESLSVEQKTSNIIKDLDGNSNTPSPEELAKKLN